jgi:hypothetical protein
VVGVDLMTKANPGARKSIAVIETRFEASESLAVGEQRAMAAAIGLTARRFPNHFGPGQNTSPKQYQLHSETNDPTGSKSGRPGVAIALTPIITAAALARPPR